MRTTRAILPSHSSPTYPTNTTPRLHLRPFHPSDAPAFHSIRSHPINSFRVDQTPSISATEEWKAQVLPPNDTKTFYFVMERRTTEPKDDEKEEGRIVGSVGINDMDPPTCGYLVRYEELGTGFATEALEGVLRMYWALPRRVVTVEEVVGGGDNFAEFGRWFERKYMRLGGTSGDTNGEVKRSEDEGEGGLGHIVQEGLRAMVEVRNAGSRRVLEKNNFKLVGGKFLDVEDFRGPARLIWYYLERSDS